MPDQNMEASEETVTQDDNLTTENPVILDTVDSQPDEGETPEEKAEESKLLTLVKSVPPEKAAEVAKGFVNKHMFNKAENKLKDSLQEGTRMAKLLTVWNALNPEGQTEFVNKGDEFLSKLYNLATKTMPLVGIAEMQADWRKMFLTKVLPADMLKLGSFPASEVQEAISLGILPCDEALAQKVDKQYGNTTGMAKKITATLAKLDPELAPINGGMSLATMKDGMVISMYPQIRAEMAQRRIAMQEAQKTQIAEHSEIAEDLKPQVALEADMPENVSVGTLPAKEEAAQTNNADNSYLDAA